MQVTQQTAELNIGKKQKGFNLLWDMSVVMQVSRRLWTCLCGNALYFFNNTKDIHVSKRGCPKLDPDGCKGFVIVSICLALLLTSLLKKFTFHSELIHHNRFLV